MKGWVCLVSDHYESFRSEVISRLFSTLPQDQLRDILNVLDTTMSGYEISRKQVEIIPCDGIPDVVKIFIASKAVENLSPGTLKIYKLRLFDFFGRVRKTFTDITAADIRKYLWFYQSQRNASDHYRDQIRRVLNSFFTWLVNNEYLISLRASSQFRGICRGRALTGPESGRSQIAPTGLNKGDLR